MRYLFVPMVLVAFTSLLSREYASAQSYAPNSYGFYNPYSTPYYSTEAAPVPGGMVPMPNASLPMAGPPAMPAPETPGPLIDGGPQEYALTPTEDWVKPAIPDPIKWEGSAELGINGTEGNAESFSMQAGGKLKRSSQWNVVSADFKYTKTNSDGLLTQHLAISNAKYEHLFESPWTFFMKVSGIYDEFKAYDYQLFLNAGYGYRVIDNDSTQLGLRGGAGTSREFGGVSENWTAEATFGLDLEHQLTERQKITLVVDYYPAWKDFSDFRMISDFGWQWLLVEQANLSLKLSLLDIYDSTPQGADPNDLTYALLLLWEL